VKGTVYTASAIASGGKSYWPKMLRKASVLPITFLGAGSSRVGGNCCGVGCGPYSVLGSMCGVGTNVGGCGGAHFAHRNLTTHPGTLSFEGMARPVVFGVLLLKVWEYMRGAHANGSHQVHEARIVILCGYTFENVRLLLLSGDQRHPGGLGNNAGQVGKHFMTKMWADVYGYFPNVVSNKHTGPAAQMWSLDDFIAADFDSAAHGFVGGAVFPTCLGVNPTLTMWALCYRAAEYLVERVRRGDPIADDVDSACCHKS
jgi:choline dehydrogenase-like flavoprotein